MSRTGGRRAGRAFVAVLMVMWAAAALGGNLSESLHATPDSWALLDAAELNGRLEAAAGAGEAWTHSPLQVTLHLFGDDAELQSLVLDVAKSHAEGAKSSTVTMIRDGILDDAVRGDWHQVDYRCLEDGTWRVVEARHAWRCRRPEVADLYGDHECR